MQPPGRQTGPAQAWRERRHEIQHPCERSPLQAGELPPLIRNPRPSDTTRTTHRMTATTGIPHQGGEQDHHQGRAEVPISRDRSGDELDRDDDHQAGNATGDPAFAVRRSNSRIRSRSRPQRTGPDRSAGIRFGEPPQAPSHRTAWTHELRAQTRPHYRGAGPSSTATRWSGPPTRPTPVRSSTRVSGT